MDNSKTKKVFSSKSVDRIFMNIIESQEIYPVQEIDKKTKKLKTSFDIGALSSNLHVMNENVRDKTPIYTNRANAKLAISWPKIIGPNSDIAYEKKKCAKNHTRAQ